MVQLVRRAPRGPDQVQWDPSSGALDPAVLASADAVVCLSGVGVGDHRWTAQYKKDIVSSRVDTVGTLATTLAKVVSAGEGPHAFLAASAVGIYGDRGDELLDETSAPGTGFLAELCRQWEAAAAPAVKAGIRVTHLRTGLVLSGDGGLLKQLKPIVQTGVAGRMGSGRQFMPWISILDELNAIAFLLTADLDGPVNLTAPDPARNADFMKTLGTVLRRPTVLPTPAFALKIAKGELGAEALGSQRAVPAALTGAGFQFSHADLETALRWALDR